MADDLIDDSATAMETQEWIDKLSRFLDLAYSSDTSPSAGKRTDVSEYVIENFPDSAKSALRLLPVKNLPPRPLYDLLQGFRTDLMFSRDPKTFPIATENDLELYAARVAGTVAELCLELVFFHTSARVSSAHQRRLISAGGRMGVALQYVNVARDIATDALIGRVYIPTEWLKEAGASTKDVLESPKSAVVRQLQARLLDDAFDIYQEAHSALAELPVEARAPMRVAIESYMEIGRVLRESEYRTKRGKATVPKLRRLRVAWNALREG